MIRLLHVYFPTRTLVLSVSEVCLIVLGFLLVGVARSSEEMSFWIGYDNGLLKVIVVSAVLVLCMYYYDLYDSIVLGNQTETLARMLQVFGTASIALAGLYFLFPQARLGNISFGLGLGLAGLSITLSRQVFLVLNRSGRLVERVAILGDGPLANSLAREIQNRPELGMRLLGLFSPDARVEANPSEFIRLGNIDDLAGLIEGRRISRLIVAADLRDGDLPIAQLRQLKNYGVMILDGMSYYEKATGKIFLNSRFLNRVIFSRGTWPTPAWLLYKRAASIVLSAVGLVLFAPLMALIAVAVKAESDGPILFCQQRVGKDRKIFTLYKFRSMRNDAGADGTFKPAQRNDERFTRLGRFLRRTRLDELPQLYNILRGDMHFIGPRPFAVEEENVLAERIPHYALRWTITPGATGWAQIQQGYCASVEDNREKLAHDLFYLQNLSVGLDLLILIRTTKILLWQRGSR